MSIQVKLQEEDLFMRSLRKGNSFFSLSLSLFRAASLRVGLTENSGQLLMSKASETSREKWSWCLNSAAMLDKPAVQAHVPQ